MPSLRTFLDQVEPHDVLRLKEAVSPHYVPTALVMELERRKRYPVIYLEDPDGFDMPLVANVFGDRKRIATAIGTDLADLDRTFNEATDRMIPPRIVDSGPVQERVFTGSDIDARALPISYHFAADAGRYIGSGVLVCKDPDTGVRNLSFQRLQLKGPDRFGVSLHSRGHIWEHLQRSQRYGRDLEVAVFIGAHPALLLAASERVAMEIDEYDIAGGLLREPVDLVRCKTIDVEVPAEAEIVLEGRILHDVTEDEGPFGEYPGYSTDRSTRNVFQLSAITRRADAIFQDLIPGNSAEHLQLAQTAKQSHILKRLRDTIPQVRALHYPKSGTNFHAYLQIEQTAPGQARHALMLLFGIDHYAKLAVAVDTDVDVANEEEVLWAIATRVQADRDTFIVPDVFCNRLDPSSHDGMSAKMGVDATRPLDWQGVQRIESEPNAVKTAHEILARLGGF